MFQDLSNFLCPDVYFMFELGVLDICGRGVDTMSYHEETLETQHIFAGEVVHLSQLSVRLPNGRTATREVIDHPGAVAVLAEPKPGHVLLVRQYRKACETELWEIPAGKLDSGERPHAAAVRELAEETGFRAEHLSPVYSFFTSPGFANEKLHVFYGEKLIEGHPELDEDEFLDVHTFARTEVESMMKSGDIQDAKTLVALLWWFQRQP